MVLRRPFSRLCLALLPLLVAACSTLGSVPRTGVSEPPAAADPAAERAWRATLARFTRHAEIYEGLDARMFFAATWEALPFRIARAERQAEFHALPESERRRLAEAERAEDQRHIGFTLGVHANARRFDDFASKDSIWRIALVSAAGEVVPVEIERLARPDLNQRALYPYLDVFWTAYRLSFPRQLESGAQVLPEGTQRFVLRISSVVGRVEMTWDVPPEAGAPR